MFLKKIRRFFRKKFFFFYKIKFNKHKGLSVVAFSNLKFSRLRFLKVVSDFKILVLRSDEYRNFKLIGNLGASKSLVSKKILVSKKFSKKFLNKFRNKFQNKFQNKFRKPIRLKKFLKKSRNLKVVKFLRSKTFIKF